MQEYIVITPYTSCYPDPIILFKDEIVMYGKEDTEYPNWIFCESIKTKKKGWVPKQILSIQNTLKAVVLQDYTANELTVNKNDKVTALSHLNNWTFCISKSGEKGWIPTNHLQPIINEKTL
ncbi:hypothetical protein J6TS2_49280 [Heyndrickxia sporothermodurans]|nr:hypothetical protein J6TS2_49280 [Heyndrickxia sporothermodurans]